MRFEKPFERDAYYVICAVLFCIGKSFQLRFIKSRRSIFFLVIDLHLFALGARVIVCVVSLLVLLANYAENVFANGPGHP